VAEHYKDVNLYNVARKINSGEVLKQEQLDGPRARWLFHVDMDGTKVRVVAEWVGDSWFIVTALPPWSRSSEDFRRAKKDATRRIYKRLRRDDLAEESLTA
jgi:hypothetical protein